MRVTAVQFKARTDPERGRADLADAIAAADGELIVAPEMAISGYAIQSPEQARALAEPTDGPTVRTLRRAARAKGSWVVAGFPERDGDRLFNSAAIVDPTGALRGVYRKRLLFEADERWARPGDRPYMAFTTDSGRFGVGICMDLNDDGFLQWCAEAELDAIAFPTNWVQEHGRVWDYWRWRLHAGWPEEAGIPERIADRRRVDAVLVGANSYGAEGRWMLRGESAILAWHTCFARTGPVGDAVLEAEIPVAR